MVQDACEEHERGYDMEKGKGGNGDGNPLLSSVNP